MCLTLEQERCSFGYECTEIVYTYRDLRKQVRECPASITDRLQLSIVLGSPLGWSTAATHEANLKPGSETSPVLKWSMVCLILFDLYKFEIT